MHTDEVAVGGQAYVALERLGPCLQSRQVGPQGVLREFMAGTAMGDHLGPHASIMSRGRPRGPAPRMIA